MRFDLDKIDTSIAYKLLVATVVPRPIAWVVSQGTNGVVNAAPYSFFNVMGPAPAIIALGINASGVGGIKDTARNIMETGEFVVNLVPERLAEAMNATAIDAPAAISELELAGLGTTASVRIKPPRISESPVAFECVKHTIVETGPHQFVVLARVLAIHIEDKFVKNAERGHLDVDGLDMIGRTYGTGYTRIKDIFNMVRPSWNKSGA